MVILLFPVYEESKGQGIYELFKHRYNGHHDGHSAAETQPSLAEEV